MDRRRRLLLLLLLFGCRPDPGPLPDRASGLAVLGQYPELEQGLRSYGQGRGAEVQALEAWLAAGARRDPEILDSIGAVAAELERERYHRLTEEVDQALIRWRDEGKLDQRLSRLDSLRVERKVLLVRLTARDLEEKW